MGSIPTASESNRLIQNVSAKLHGYIKKELKEKFSAKIFLFTDPK